MELNETPYIKIKRNGQIDNTAATIAELNNNIQIVYSYNTIIGAFIQYYDKRIYLKDSCSYSTTTAGKHHPRAAAIANHNHFKIIEVKHKTIIKAINNPEILKGIFQEVEIKNQILKALYENNHFFKNLKCYDYIEARRKEHKEFKNSNFKNIYYKKTTFKYLPQIYYKVTHHAKNQLKPSKGYFYKYSYKVVIEEV